MSATRQGAPRATLRTVAARAGVSTSTASLAFADDPRVAPPTRTRVMRAAAELGYAGPDPVARSLRQRRSGVVGAVVGQRLSYAFADPLAVAVLDGLAAELDPLGCALLLLGGGGDDGQRVAQVGRAAVDAVVWVTCGTAADPAMDLLLRRGIPVVGIEGPHACGIPLVDIDNHGASADLARLLVGLGHRRIAVASLPWRLDGRRGPLDTTRRAQPGRDDSRNRLAGVESVVGTCPTWEAAGNQREEGERAALALLSGPEGVLAPQARPTAVVAQSDLLAVGVIAGARSLGLQVPGDLSVVGFDGIETPWLGADVLTSVVQPSAEKGRAAGRAVALALAGQEPRGVVLPVQQRVGTTSAPPAVGAQDRDRP